MREPYPVDGQYGQSLLGYVSGTASDFLIVHEIDPIVLQPTYYVVAVAG